MEGAHVIDIDELANSTTRKVKDESSAGDIPEKNPELPLFFMIKEQYCDNNINKEAYAPNVLSVGPYHHKTTVSMEVEKIKWISLSNLLELNTRKKMRDCIKGMEELGQKMRICYACEIQMSSYDLLKMMLLDECCLLSVLRGMEGII